MTGFGDFGAPGGEPEWDLDLTSAEDVPEFKPLPQSTYVLMSDEAEGTTSRDGKENIIRVHWKVWEGPFEGRQISDGLFIPNPNTQTPDKFRQSINFFTAKLEAITGEPWKGQNKKLRPSMLVGKLVQAKVIIKKGDSGEFNSIQRYYRYEIGGTPSPVNPSPVSSGTSGAPSPFSL